MNVFFNWMKKHMTWISIIMIGMMIFSIYVLLFINRVLPRYENMAEMPLSEWFWVMGFILLPIIMLMYPLIIHIKKKKYVDVMLLASATVLYCLGTCLIMYAYLLGQVYVPMPDHPTINELHAYMWQTSEIRSQALVIQGIGSAVIMLTFFLNLIIQGIKDKFHHQASVAV